jgi:hypothetical protein
MNADRFSTNPIDTQGLGFGMGTPDSMDSDSFQAYFALDRNKSPEHKRLGWILFGSHHMCRTWTETNSISIQSAEQPT